MMDALRRGLLSLCALALFCSLVRALLPEGNTKKICVSFGGIFLALAVLGMVRQIDLSDFSQILSRARISAEQAQTGVEIQNREALCSIIKAKTEAYILDKAEALGLSVEAEVELEEDAAYPYPKSVFLRGIAAPGVKAELSRLIEENLAIGKEHQHWSSE